MRLVVGIVVALMLALPMAAARAEPATAAIAASLAAADRPPADRAADSGRRPADMLALLDLKPGQRVLDLVAGGGYYSRLAAPIVAPGILYAHSTDGLMDQRGMAERWSGLKAAHPNVRLILGVPGRFPLPAQLDRVIFHLTFHDLWWESAEYRIPQMDPDAFLAQLRGAIVPGGLVLIVDHSATAGAAPRAETEARHRIDPAVAKAAMTKAGFVLVAESDLLAVPADDLSRLVYDPAVRGRTDRFVQVWHRP
ncbi:MAG: methyltransferase [Sandaracinobacter sp.]